jgi:hypothetical protein
MRKPTHREIFNGVTLNGYRMGDIIVADWNPTWNDGREHGGWVYFDPYDCTFTFVRAAAGTHRRIELKHPPLLPGSWYVVGVWHTHPGPPGEPNPSGPDKNFAKFYGVPAFVVGGPEGNGPGLAIPH